jgi:hypothetical protein
MPDEILRLKTTVVADEAFARIRQLEQSLQRMQREAGRGAQQTNVQFQNLTKTFQGMHREVSTLGRSLGSMLGGLTAGMLMRGVADVAKRVTELKYASKELGLSERDLRAWQNAAETVGGSAEQMTAGLAKFQSVTQGLKYDIGGMRTEMYRLGLGPIARQLQEATTQAERLKIAFDFGETLQVGSVQWRTYWDLIGIGQENARGGYEKYLAALAKGRERTAEEIAQAEKMHKALTDIGQASAQSVSEAK